MSNSFENPSILILIPNIQSKDDFENRINNLIKDTNFNEKSKTFEPDNTLAPDEWEYECFPGNISTMADIIDYIRVTDPELFGMKF